MSKKKKNKKPATANTKNLNIFSEQQKAINFFNNLNFIQRKYVSDYAELKQIEFQRCFLEHIDCVLTATLINEFKELNLDEIGEIVENFTKLFVEHIDSKKNDREKGREEIMAKRKEMEPKIIKMCEKLLEEGKNQKENIEALKYKFPTISKSELTNCYKRIKEMKVASEKLKKVEVVKSEDKEIEDALDYIFEEEKKSEKVVKVAEKDEIVATIEERKEEIKEIAYRADTLRIISKKITVQGMFGQYEKDETGVKHGDEYWTSVDAVRKRTVEEAEKIDKRIKEIKEDIEKLENKKDHITGTALELEQVFQM